MSSRIRVLIVDDSAFIRNALSGMLSKSPDIDVIGIARNGEDALTKVVELSPDVMTLDIEMPGMNGLQVLKTVMAEHPLPVIMVSSLTEESAKETLQALEFGAVDFISKQSSKSVLDISKIEKLLLSKVKAAVWARSHVTGLVREPMVQKNPGQLLGSSFTRNPRSYANTEKKKDTSHKTLDSVVIIGSSTGGPKVIQDMLEEFPATLSSAVIVIQHMPKFFTKPFAERLNQLCPLTVQEAKDGDPLVPGQILVAPGSHHLRVENLGVREVGVRVSCEPVHLPYRPSVDLAMETGAKALGPLVIGVILTGMGNDGERGMRAIKEAGGHTLAQNEATCMIFGMPKAAIDSGYVDAVVPISRMTTEILHRIEQNKKHPAQQVSGVHSS